MLKGRMLSATQRTISALIGAIVIFIFSTMKKPTWILSSCADGESTLLFPFRSSQTQPLMIHLSAGFFSQPHAQLGYPLSHHLPKLSHRPSKVLHAFVSFLLILHPFCQETG
jgi:hypothetical protein